MATTVCSALGQQATRPLVKLAISLVQFAMQVYPWTGIQCFFIVSLSSNKVQLISLYLVLYFLTVKQAKQTKK